MSIKLNLCRATEPSLQPRDRNLRNPHLAGGEQISISIAVGSKTLLVMSGYFEATTSAAAPVYYYYYYFFF